jgi:hypothetical protein
MQSFEGRLSGVDFCGRIKTGDGKRQTQCSVLRFSIRRLSNCLASSISCGGDHGAFEQREAEAFKKRFELLSDSRRSRIPAIVQDMDLGGVAC